VRGLDRGHDLFFSPAGAVQCGLAASRPRLLVWDRCPCARRVSAACRLVVVAAQHERRGDDDDDDQNDEEHGFGSLG
jgi:hypothetical protein